MCYKLPVTNEFYGDFDVELLGERISDYRSPFQQDRDRIVYTSAFRRLQAKTQVFSVGEYDFYRTRLTHSLEVAQIGRSICYYLQEHDPALSASFYVDPDLVEAVCLAHDLGHPPFGHSGERTLHELMRPYGGFEGNAQTLRLITDSIYSRRGRRTGLRPTRALLDGVMKYKAVHGACGDPDNHFLYDEQAPHVAFVFGGLDPPEEMAAPETLNQFRSIECQVMDWADDTAYSLNDLTDGVRAGFLTVKRIEAWAEDRNPGLEGLAAIEDLLGMIREGNTELTISGLIGDFIHACSLEPRDSFMNDRTQRYGWRLVVDEGLRERADTFSRLATDLVFRSARLQQLEYKGRFMLTRVFGAYREMYLDSPRRRLALLPEHWEQAVLDLEESAGRARLLCDYLAGMTDGYAVRTYQRLFDPESGSILDIV